MTGKNIRKHLRRKIDNWCESVPEIASVIKADAIITGGAIVSLLQGEIPNDYDVYFKTKSSTETVARYYVDQFLKTHPGMDITVLEKDDRVLIRVRSAGVAEVDDESEPKEEEPEEPETPEKRPPYRPKFFSANAITLSDQIQIITRFCGTPEEIHKNYDFIHCTCWYDYKSDHLELPARALEAILNKELYYMGSRYPLCSIIRTRKFINRGWNINAGQYVKMALDLNELNLKDLEVFEDQLIGVDSLYFARAITAIQEKVKEDSMFSPDNSYLFEVINRIF